MKTWIFLLVLSAYSPLNFAADTGIPNFTKITDGFYRGGRPQPTDFFTLTSLGVKTVIDLQGGDLTNSLYREIVRWYEPGEDPQAIDQERQTAEGLNIRFESVPLDSLDPVTPDEDAAIDRILNIIAQTPNQPVFIHCEHGIDRTGLVSALFEVIYMHKNPDDAYAEWRALGHKGFGGYMTSYLDDYFWDKVNSSHPGARTAAGN